MALTIDPSLHTRLAGLGLNEPLAEVAAADIETKPIDIYRVHLASTLASIIGCDVSTAYDAMAVSADLDLADLTVILPRLKPKEVTDVKTWAFEVIKKLPISPLFPLPYADGVQLRFFFSAQALPALLLPYIHERKQTYGQDISQGLRDAANPDHGRKKIVVEFSSPNIPGEFNGNHLRSTLLGEFASRMYECMGWDVVRLNYLGDWGKNFALFAVGWPKYGSEADLQADPLGHILHVYTEISRDFQPELDERKQAKGQNENTAEIESRGIFAERDSYFKNLEDGDSDAVALWQRFRDIAIENLTLAYQRLGIKFDEYSGESQPKPETLLEVESVLSANNILEESDGSRVVNFEQHGGKGLGTQILRGRTGSSTYLLRDVAAALDRYNTYSFDKMFYVATSRQTSHFKQAFKTIELMGLDDLASKLQHVEFGEIQGLSKQPNKSPPLTKPLLLTNILDECGEIMRDAAREDQGDEISEESLAAIGDPTAISGILSQDQFGKRAHGYVFDPKRMTAFNKDSGLKLQQDYHLLSAAVGDLNTPDVAAAVPDYTALQDEDIIDLLRLLAQYPDLTLATYKSLEPHGILTFLCSLADAAAETLSDDSDTEDQGAESSSAAQDISVEGNKARLMLYESVKQVLGHGMRLLGFPVL